MLRQLFTTAAISLALAGCASSTPHSFGDKLAVRSEKANALSKQWSTGQAYATKGEKMVKKGQELISDGKKAQKKGENLIEDGQKLIENGRKQMTDSEAAYRDIANNPIPATTTTP